MFFFRKGNPLQGDSFITISAKGKNCVFITYKCPRKVLVQLLGGILNSVSQGEGLLFFFLFVGF